MPAKRLTADCIWNSFHSSNKRHIILTGTRGSGKTTLLSKLFSENLPGITTFAEPQKAVYLKENLTDKKVQVGFYDAGIEGSENKMVLNSDGFVSLGVPTLKRCAESNSAWVTIDEIGYLEAQCKEYHDAVRNLLSIKQVAMVVRKQNLPFINELFNRDDTFVVDLDEPFGNIGCVIMASGFGKRFGANKLLTDFNGKSLIAYILDATEDVFSKRVVVTRYKEIENLCKERGVRRVLHDLHYRNDTVRLGLEAVKEVDRCMFVTADQPLLSNETIKSLALASLNDDRIWRTIYGNIQGSPVVFPRWTFEELLSLEEGKGGREVVKNHIKDLHFLNVENPYELRDIDSPKDLIELEKFI